MHNGDFCIKSLRHTLFSLTLLPVNKKEKTMNQLYQSKQTIRFRRWSRKAYAMFFSLGKCVTIGSLKKGIADVSLGKQSDMCIMFSVCNPLEKEDADKEKAEEGLNPFEKMLQLFLVQPQQQVAGSVSLLLLVIYNQIAGKVRDASSRLFLCIHLNEIRC